MKKRSGGGRNNPKNRSKKTYWLGTEYKHRTAKLLAYTSPSKGATGGGKEKRKKSIGRGSAYAATVKTR